MYVARYGNNGHRGRLYNRECPVVKSLERPIGHSILWLKPVENRSMRRGC